MENKAPSSGIKPPQVSRLAPPGSLTKRARPGSVDLEDLDNGLDAKKLKMNPPESKGASNLNKARSKSTINLTDKSSVRGRSTLSSRPAAASRPTISSRPMADRRATTTSALNNRTNQDNRALAREKTSLSGLRREKSSISRGGGGGVSAPGRGGKRPAWDLKGRLEDMEAKFEQTQKIIGDLQTEKQNLEVDNEVKLEVVTKTSKEATELKSKLDKTEAELSDRKKKQEKAEEEHNTEVTRLRRQLENEEFNRSSLERKHKSLEDELTSKQTEISGLKNSVAELVSSRSGLEASLSTTQMSLEAANTLNTKLTQETESLKLELQRLVDKSNWEETERRKLHNLVQELKGNIRVFCRLRPLIGDEIAKYGSINHIKMNSDSSLELIKSNAEEGIASGTNKNAKYEFEFDRVFDSSATQNHVFQEISQLIQSALDGYNVCVFAYGQTGSGKTYTMEGGDVSDPEQAGMIPKTISQIFEVTSNLKEKGWTYSLEASFLEIYNEEIRDLLATEKNLKYDIKMTDAKGSDVYVTNLNKETVNSRSEVMNLLKRARKHRAVAETLCNERSSRSHSVFILKISGSNSVTTESCCGTLNLVDLAGSERVKDSGSEGQRLTEARSINSSLSNLGNVIMALAQKTSHIPYRNSKLTHLLQNSLGGNSKTLMFVNLNPREDTFNENLNSLRFATKVNQCHIGTAVKKVK